MRREKNRHREPDMTTEFRCETCGAFACYGFNVTSRDGRLGRWYCAQHQDVFKPIRQEAPEPPKSDDVQAMTLSEVQNELRRWMKAGLDGEPRTQADKARIQALWQAIDATVRQPPAPQRHPPRQCAGLAQSGRSLR
jgi:hypothetical protein